MKTATYQAGARFPDCYARLIEIWYLLEHVRKSISGECSGTADEVYIEILAQADDDVAAAQRLLRRATERILKHHQ
ncbi:MAG: hypothetical protein FJ403_02985 [Verrucomicrobia bacterium]|nr:hypothetical protein [Verrucomicrobiota bacterium]